MNGYRALEGSRLTGAIDFGGASLQEYVEKYVTESELAASPRRNLHEFSSTQEDHRNYEELHTSIRECDDVLASVETYLTDFQAELGQVSTEIEHLQSRSLELNAQLDIRRKVEKLLGPAIEEVTVSPQTVKTISEGPVDDNWIRALNEIENCSATIEAMEKSAEANKALEDVKPLLNDLKSKAIERIRDFIVAQIKALRSPNVNAQILQQQTLVRFKELYAFLARNHKLLAEEIGQAYVNTMKWYYSSNFTRYQQALEKIQIHSIDQTEVLGAEAPASRRVLSGTKSLPPQHDAFSIGRRADLLKVDNRVALPAHLAEEDKTYHYLEVVFENFNQAVVDNVSFEYAVLTELFSAQSFQHVSRKVVEIFEPTFALGHSLTKQLVEHTADCLGVLICVRLNQHFAFELQRRKVPVADSYINGTNMLLWPRFQMTMDMQCESLKKLANTANRGAVAAFSLVGGTDASKTSAAPHAVAQRFGQFLRGILVLSSEAADDEPVSSSLSRLRNEFQASTVKLAKGVGDATKRNRFLSNNYSLVLTIISDTHGKLADEHKAYFEALLKETNVS